MSLQLMLGRSGSGKTSLVCKKMIQEAVKHPEENYILLVPEQFTMEAQKDLILMHPRHCLLNMDVQSFPRLAYRIFDELNMENISVLQDTGKNLILKKVLAEHGKELKVFKNKTGMQGFASEMKSVLSEFWQYGILEDQMKEIKEKTTKRPLLAGKLGDIALLSGYFHDFLSENQVTTEGVLPLFVSVMEQSQILKGSHVILDGFTGFSPVQYQIIGKLLTCASDVTVTMTLPKGENLNVIREQELFAMSKTAIRKLKKLAEENMVSIQMDLYAENLTDGKDRFKEAEELSFLEQNLFRASSQPYPDNVSQISITGCKNPKEEMECVVSKIQELVQQEKLRYRDIAVVTADMETYYRFAERLFEENQIPAFIDHKRSIMGNPAVEAIRGILEIAKNDFSYESIFHLLKTRMLRLNDLDVDQLENYLIATGIRGHKAWTEGFTATGRIVNEDQLKKINETREQFMELAGEKIAGLRGKDLSVRELTTRLYELLTGIHMQETMQTASDRFSEAGDLGKSKEYDQIYGKIMQLFDEIVDIMGEEVLPLKEYADILDAGLEEIKVGIIPPNIDQVLVGDLDRTRLNHVKVLFFVGVNDGLVPKRTGSRGILTETDRTFLETCDVTLSPTARENSYIERYYLYINLTKPEKKLFLSYAKTDSQGQGVRPSYLLSVLLRMFPKMVHTEYESEGNLDKVHDQNAAYHYLAEQMQDFAARKECKAWDSLFAYIAQHYGDEVLLSFAKGAFSRERENQIDAAVAEQLYGKTLSGSVSRLEKYAACAYAHFLGYGLALLERKEHQIEMSDLGTMYHDALQMISEKLKKDHLRFQDLTDEAREQVVEETVESLADDASDSVITSSARNLYVLNNLKRVINRSVWMISNQLKHGEFEPYAFEYEVAPKEARVDRIDLLTKDDEVYVKIIDYKTGSKEFALNDVYQGLQLQLASYMRKVINRLRQDEQLSGKEIFPGAMFYQEIKDPFVSTQIRESDDAYLKEFMPSGLVSAKPVVVKGLDQQLGSSSCVMKVGLKKDGNYTAVSSVARPEEFDRLLDYVDTTMQDLDQEIVDGHIEVNPYQKGQKNACQYCKYKGACGFDPNLPGDHYRMLSAFKNEELWEKMKEKLQKKGENNGSSEMDE